MIGLILGTSEGKKILSLLNKFTQDIFVSTATEYGGELLKDYKYKEINTKPLDASELEKVVIENGIDVLVDASHPYAEVVTKNAVEVCKKLNIIYARYERPKTFLNDDKHVIRVKDYSELYLKMKDIEGTILNTTGSNNIDKFINMNLKNRMIHRVLPSIKVMEKCFSLRVKTEDIIAIKGPISYQLNCSFIKEYDAKAMILKDSGVQGGTDDKIKAAIDMDIKAFVIVRKDFHVGNTFNSEEEITDFVKDFLDKQNIS
ncbi:precorrin-6A/cobalt-precorrin-6A reductase [Clostridium acidisoli DSM 12555]|uniref:Precorrin-6A/cobalt-precorrin-6A reductase n=1 Tax=Clostridium acidisoli DSM 12555 TaxID=1121291 RepID=A0A1W1XXA4_9CLOT|nr:cobalt-precorrin-6A reductase [Clostridium acidisoli]SMC28610.1 precorrin-6A/cobalt-precorrin-6A reductase [Clostridium acidisoli DSM 12555]